MSHPPARPVTMADVGRAAGVTARTVSNVLSGKVNVRPETRDAVIRAVQELGYQMNVSARGLRTGRTGFITLALPDLGIEYFAELARAVMAEAGKHHLTVIIQQTGGDLRTELDILSGTSRQLSDGLIFQPHALGPSDERVLTGGGPLVLLGDRIFDGPVDHVTMANTEAVMAATQYLIDRGRRHIAAIGVNPAGGPISAASLRYEGFRLAHESSGLPLDEERVALATEWHQSNGASAMARLLDKRIPIDGVICFNDSLAFGALHTLVTRGVSVPREVAVVGFDNVTAAAYSNPSLTTIDPGSADIARISVELLTRRIAEGPTSHPSEIVTDFSLVVRRSA
ncbi:LacI family DNA-binding transcriptional regulator [Streptomyces sp. YIM S03343]